MQRQPHDEEDDERHSLSQATALPAPAELTRRAQGVAKLIKGEIVTNFNATPAIATYDLGNG
eukprot:6187777-Pleurochrysis_carterae.AAC.1